MWNLFGPFGLIFLCLLCNYCALTDNTSSDIELNSKAERQRFESLLAGGRSLAFPFAVGLILTVVSGEKENWNVSLQGLNEILNLSPDQLFSTYQDALQLVKQEEDKLTFSSNLYSLQKWVENENSTQRLNRLNTSVQAVQWGNVHSESTWELINSQLNDRTNNLLGGKLLPKDTEYGSPFKFSTKALLTSAFHYKSAWKSPWVSSGLSTFGSFGKVPFLQTEGELDYADEEDFTALNIPLEGSKSIVFILPKVNLTRYLQKSKKLEKLLASRVEEEDSDFVPFPKRWEKRDLSVFLPAFNLTATDQYGKELFELGMNQTFCTTLHDRRGQIPFYLRPIVQVSSVLMTESFLEIASATGTAVEKFYFGLDLSASGYPKGRAKPELVPSEQVFSTEPFTDDDNDDITTTLAPKEKLVFNRPFLFYLNDAKQGPLIYGVVDRLKEETKTSPEEDSKLEQEVQRLLIWSCRTFKQSAEMDETLVQNDRT